MKKVRFLSSILLKIGWASLERLNDSYKFVMGLARKKAYVRAELTIHKSNKVFF